MEGINIGKFFKRQPLTCSICGEEKKIKKKVRTKDGKFYYCEQCWDILHAHLRPKITQEVLDRSKKKQVIGMKETKEITEKLTTELTQDLKN